MTGISAAVLPRGALGQVSYGGGGGGGGGAVPGSEPLPYFRENRTPKTYPILGNPTITAIRSGPDSENMPYFRENFIILRTRSGPDSKNIPYFREI